MAKCVLLTIGTIPYPVEEKIQNREKEKGGRAPAICGWVMVCQVQGAVAIGEGYSSHVPKSKHEAQLLKVHVPAPVSTFV